MHTHRADKDRVCRAVAAETAEDVLGALTLGCRISALLVGSVSMLDVLVHVLDATGPANVLLSTWTHGIRDADRVRVLVDDRRILSARLLLDRSFASRQPEMVRDVVAPHGSGNLNRNDRLENVDLDDDPALCDMPNRSKRTRPTRGVALVDTSDWGRVKL